MTASTNEAFEELWERHHRRVLAYALRRTDRATAEDVVSETFLTAWRRRQEQPGDELAWLLGVARHLLQNQSRGEQRRDALVAAQVQVAEQHHPDPATVDHSVLIALAALSDSDREALVLTGWDGLQPSEAARVVGCSSTTFRVRLLRARRRLARQLDRPLPSAATATRPTESRA